MSKSRKLFAKKLKHQYIKVSRFCHLLIFISVVSGLTPYVLIVYASVLAHECAHLLMCCKLRVKTYGISVYPYGAELKIKTLICPKKQILISSAGPFCSFVLFVLGKCVNVFLGNMYVSFFANANLTLLLFNMLPCTPLDGGEILRSIISNRFGIVYSYKIITYISYFFETIFLISGCLLCAYSGGNMTLIIVAMIIITSIIKTKNTIVYTTGKILTNSVNSSKKIKLITKGKSDRLASCVKYISFGYTLIVAVFDGEKYCGFVTQSQILEKLKNHQTFGECVEINKHLLYNKSI